MSSTEGSASPEGQSKFTKKMETWDHNTWDALQVIILVSNSTDMINIVSTKHDHDGEPFRASVHKDLLCAYSAHYSAVLERRSSEDKEDAIKMDLPWCRMQNLVGWLYTGTMAWDDLDELLELYVFADQTKILALRRFIMSKIIQDYDLDCEDSMPYLERLSHSCGLFRYLVDLWAGKWSQMIDHPYQIEELDGHGRIPRMFFYQALRKLAIMVDDKEFIMAALKIPDNYHEHLNVSEWKTTCHRDDHRCVEPDDD